MTEEEVIREIQKGLTDTLDIEPPDPDTPLGDLGLDSLDILVIEDTCIEVLEKEYSGIKFTPDTTIRKIVRSYTGN